MLVVVVRRCLIAIAGALAIAAVAGSPAAADAAAARSVSSNWAGYVASGRGVHFRTVFGTWVQPAASCSAGTPATAAVWVGIGGYPSSAHALEQIGTELDCTKTGTARYSAWYELVPATSVTIPLTVHPGDRLAASVSVTGHRVRLRLHNLTTNATFTKTRRAPDVDTGSAEWIVEAPTLCDPDGGCEISQLTDFGTTTFSIARAATTTGHTGTIADPAWTQTALDLDPGGQALGNTPDPAITPAGAATTGDLSPTGDGFNVTYQPPAPTTPSLPTETPTTPQAPVP
jgi:hypothetical protein